MSYCTPSLVRVGSYIATFTYLRLTLSVVLFRWPRLVLQGTLSLPVPHFASPSEQIQALPKTLPFSGPFLFWFLDTARVQRSVSFLALLCRMPVPIRFELQGISHVVSIVPFHDVKAF